MWTGLAATPGTRGSFAICIARTREVVQPHTFPSAWRPLLAFPYLADSLSPSLVMCTPACLRTVPCWACPPVNPFPPTAGLQSTPLSPTDSHSSGCPRPGVSQDGRAGLGSRLPPHPLCGSSPGQPCLAVSAGGLLVPSLCRHRCHP